MPKSYTYSNGVFTFPSESCILKFSRVEKNRYGSLFADVAVMTPDGLGYLTQDHGELSSDRFRQAIAASAAKRNSGSPILIDNVLLEAYLAVKDDPAVASAVPLPAFVSAAEFAKRPLPELPEIVEGLISPGRLYVVGAKPKSGKTLLLMNLALAVAGGRTALGRRTQAGRVAFFQLEDSERTLQKRLKAMCPDGAVPTDLLLHIAPFRLVEENFQETLASLRGCSLVICDPIVQATEIKDWNAQDEVRRGYDLWRRLARESDAAVILSAHHRKMDGDYGDALAGSVQAMATVDGILELYRNKDLDKGERRMSYLGRDWGDLPDEVIRLNADTLTWEPFGSFQDRVDEAKEGKRLEKGLQVLDVLPNGPPGMTIAEIVEHAGLGRNLVSEGLKALGAKVARGGTARSKADPLRYWRAAA